MPSGLPTAPDELIGYQPPPKIPSRRLRGGFEAIIPSTPIVGETTVHYNPVIILLMGYLHLAKPGALEDAVAAARKEIPDFMNKLNITDAPSFLEFANDLLK